MKLNYRYLSLLLMTLPLLTMARVWDHLPARVPMHFNAEGQPDRFGSRQEWMNMLLSSLFLLLIFRAVLLGIAGGQPNIQPSQRRMLSLISAGTVSGIQSLLILQGLWQSPVYAQWFPVLFFLAGSCFIYFSVPEDLPVKLDDPEDLNTRLGRRLSSLKQIHTLSRLVVLRANLLAVLVMVFAHHQDRWSIGILANVLAYTYLLFLTVTTNRNVN